MAERPVFISTEKGFPLEKMVIFTWHPGLSKEQKRQSIRSLHTAAAKEEGSLLVEKILEISTKSEEPVGRKASAFNLEMDYGHGRYSVEKIFQAGKIFEQGGPYADILEKSSLEAKQDERLKKSGSLKSFRFGDNDEWPLNPETAFYDWLYIRALLDKMNYEIMKKLVQFDAFSDIEFNPQKSVNCQARSAALFVSLYKKYYGDMKKIRLIHADREAFIRLYPKREHEIKKRKRDESLSLLESPKC